MANEEFGGTPGHDAPVESSPKEEEKKEDEKKEDEDTFDFWEWIDKNADKFVALLKKFLPDKADKFIDALENKREKVAEFIDKFDEHFFTIFDVINWLVNNFDELMGFVYKEDGEKKEEEKKRYDYELDEWIPYESVNDNAKISTSKLKDAVNSRILSGEDIDISAGIPNLEEMFSDDLAYDFFKNLANSDKDSDVVNNAFYCDTPEFTLGYNTDHTFLLEYPAGEGGKYFPDLKSEMHMNSIDGDTAHFYLDSFKGCDIPFTTTTGQNYEGFKDYCEKNNLGSSILQVRYIGIDCPELPHYSAMVMKEDQIKKMTINEALKKSGSVIYRKYNYNDGNVTDRDLDTECKFYVNGNTYMEIVEENTWEYVTNKTNLLKTDQFLCNNVITQDDSTKETLADGYRCRTVAYSVLKNAQRIILKLDANGIHASRTSSRHKIVYNHWWHGHEAIASMVDQWKDAMVDNTAPLSRLTFAPFGTDGYGRFVGEVYVYTKIKGKLLWINLNKYVLAHVNSTKVYYDLTSSPEMNNVFGSNAKAFNLWSYNKNNMIYLDSFEEQTKESYNNRLKFHKDITGIDFTAFRNCTMMLGDTLLLIPPTAIRNVSNVEYEKVNVLRGKGSMVKGVTAREQYLEIDLYFYDEYGINGIPYNQTLPNGEKMTYYMNGLRSLIAQFKVAPYLPIENQYINDILGIEAVSLVNLNVNTVEGFPKLLQATLTLRDFNYRIFMPDIPFDYGSEEELTLGKISEMNPIFAKCFHWEIFRYYYQRIIAKGSKLSQLEYGTEEYNKALYNSKYALKTVNFCSKSDAISFYIPDEDWLKAALQIKKEKDYYAQMPITVELTNNGKDFFKKVGATEQYFKVDEQVYKKFTDIAQISLPEAMTNKEGIAKKENVLSGDKTMLWAKDRSTTGKEVEALKNLIMSIANNVETCGYLVYDSTDEEYDENKMTMTWYIKFRIVGSLSSEDMLCIREKLRDLLGKDNIGDILKGDILTISMTINLDEEYQFTGKPYIKCDEISAMYNYDDDSSGGGDIAGTYDYLNPAALPFVPYVEEVSLQGLAFNMSNTFTEMSLKMMDGSAPQYMGSSDVSIELRIVTDNLLHVSMLNVLPSHSMNIAKTYRRVLNCWPIKVRQNFLNMAGINEVLIDSVQIENVEGYPGLYDLRIRLTSVDRVMRQREMMKQLETREEITTLPEHAIGTYFDIENTLSQAETYPDLDIPSLNELYQVGYKFLRYSGIARAYPDPDFYMVYSYDYTSRIIKKTIRDIFIKNGLLHCDDENYETNNEAEVNIMVEDHVGQKLGTRLAKISGVDIIKLNGVAYYYSDAISEADKVSDANLKKDLGETYDEQYANNVDSLMMLTLFDVEEGWEVKQGWEATICPKKAEDNIRLCQKSNLSSDSVKEEIKIDPIYNFIFDRRKEIIKAIDKILGKPLVFGKETKDNKDKKRVDAPLYAAVAGFNHHEDGKALLRLMNPFGYGDETALASNFKFYKNITGTFEQVNVLNYLCAFAFAAACTLSGEKAKLDESAWEDYFPNQYVISDGKELEDDDGNLVPLSYIAASGNPRRAKTKKEAIDQGYTFGMFQITKENKDKILERIRPTSKVDYLGNNNTFKMYDDYKDGFIDPYYNKLDKNDSELKDYVNAIATHRDYNALAFLRIMLVYLRKQIIDGLIISDIDYLAVNWSEEIGEDTAAIQEEAWKIANVTYSYGVQATYGSDMYGQSASYYDAYKQAERNLYREKTGTSEDMANQQLALIESVKKSYSQSFCMRWVFPFVEAATQQIAQPDIDTLDLIYNKKLDELNLLSAALLSTSTETNRALSKFLMALSGNVINLETTKADPSTTSDSQKVLNILLREAFTELAEDPQAYVLHSFYDMLTNDKRGRLIRAFPTYYVMFIDEGRRIGSWKMFDNFYNMSAISELTVTKSRKLPTDTCSFVMTNMFGSYANEYDEATRENYVDVYSFRDVYTSIFSPRQYISKEAALERRQKNTEVTVLKPGVRIHIRMGYGSDAAGLPVVFNGKIAEIDIGDVVTIIGQGDGSELVNPLNALGDIDATNLIESQSWCTLFKDLRGSLARGGLSPRNLLTQLLTAEHGGVLKNISRYVSGDRFFSDNPFGIYHFGDRRFTDIFIEGEVTQNIYEVTDGTLLAGMNELYTSEQSVFCSPTLNTTLQDKTFWDLLTLSAYSGVGYIGAIRDFGFRSTVCLCKPNHYYAYAYAMTDGKYIEKRKPFQQFHYYDSYTDIIYNSIKASEKNIKTNATGIWEGTDLIWGSEQKTCGPIYLDINIYPEYQKSMTVDTGLIAAGNGGIDIPFVTSLAEDWNLSANTDKVNKTLAERVTLNTLRESVMNMYTGEICVIGDPSVKPYDRISITDTYEDMQGQMEVEAVVFSMNAATGFTTTIYPDLIVRQDDPHEIARQNIAGNITAGLIAVVTTRIGVISTLARVSSKLLTGMAGFLNGVITASATEGTALAVLKGTAAGKLLGLTKGSGLIKSIATFFSTASIPTWAFMIIAAATVFVLTQNAKSYVTRWLRNIQALDVYPILKNQRPYIAGMNGHRGSVVGYNYSESDANDSVQGMVIECVEWADNLLGGLGAPLLNIFMDRGEYEKAVQSWATTLTYLDCGEEFESMNSVESIYQNAYSAVSTEYSYRSASIQMLRTKYRVKSFNTNGGTDPTYLKYRILGVAATKNLDDYKEPIKYKNNSVTDIQPTSIYTNKNLLSLYPIEDDIDVKKAVAGNEGVAKLEIAHSRGNSTRNLPFESGSRLIRFNAENNPTAELASYPILDMPMLQEDALYLLKFILSSEHMRGKQLQFMSGVRVNDIRTWKNTGFCFELQSKDASALKNALDTLKSEVYWTMSGKQNPFFEYKDAGDGLYIISVYPEAEHDYDNNKDK